MNPKTSSSVGPKLSSSVCQRGGGGFSGLALMVTPCCSRSGSGLSSANDGRWVMKWVAVTELLGDSLIAVGWAGAKRTLVTKMFTTRRMPRVIQKRQDRNGFRDTGTGVLAWPGGLAGGLGAGPR